jgi:hypothetical protein
MTHHPGAAQTAAQAPTPAGTPNVPPRPAQSQDGPIEMAWCSSCRRDHRMVRCESCGIELPSHWLVHLCPECKLVLRQARK